MNYILKGHNFENEIQTISQIFYPNEKFIKTLTVTSSGVTVVSTIENKEIIGEVFIDGKLICSETSIEYADNEKQNRHVAKQVMYKALAKATGFYSQWGILTGIRPSKIIHTLLDKGLNDFEIIQHMKDKHYTSSQKTKLCIEVAKAESEILKKQTGNEFSLYVGIPFCPTKCNYCSFTSYPITKYENAIDDYLNCLKKELEYCKHFTHNKTLQTIYVGGGTPTSINENQLEFLLDTIHKNYSVSKTLEFTVEAGRPDTITKQKLDTLKRFGVNRISINPQTMNDKTLAQIGRQHTVSDFLKAFYLAREAGHENINVDIIVGLLGEGISEITQTMEQILKLQPENLTVHTLAVKRASILKQSGFNFEAADMLNKTEAMLNVAKHYAKQMYMSPYYMYRQKNMCGNLENIGYCKKGYEGLYNVYIMEECQTIVAVGAGAITKIVEYKDDGVKIERAFNVKDVLEYIGRIDEMINRKESFL